MKNKITNILIVLLILVGIGILLYPTIADKYNQSLQADVIKGYAKITDNFQEEDYSGFWEPAKQYNESLINKQDRYSAIEEEYEQYRKILSVTEDGMMAFIEIPKIKVELPIYHGTDDTVLQTAVGHIYGSSLPIGGPSTHCLLSGHRGLPSASLFTSIDKLVIGDEFFINVLGEKHRYMVDEIQVVEPDELDNIKIIEGKDYCTLVTCTPYGINSHRLLVRGERDLNSD